MGENPERRRRRPKGEGLLDLQGLAERWGMDEEDLKQIIRSESIPFIPFGKPEAEKIRWDRVIFRLEAIQKWEASNQVTYVERKKDAAGTTEPPRKSPIRGGYKP